MDQGSGILGKRLLQLEEELKVVNKIIAYIYDYILMFTSRRLWKF